MAGVLSGAFSGAYMFWVGIDSTPETTPEQAEALGSYYRDTHMAEFLSKNPGFTRATRYELVDQDPRGNLGPTWLTMYEMGDEAAYQAYQVRGALPADQKPKYQPRPAIANELPTKWRMVWRKVSEEGSASAPPEGLFMVGMNVPEDTTAEGLAEFNDFYTNTHVREVMALGSYDRGLRYELDTDMQHQEPGCPRFCAIYTADEAALEAVLARRKADPGPNTQLSSGPPTWEAHDTLWRLVYRLVATTEI